MLPKILRSEGPPVFNDARPVLAKLRENAFVVLPAAYGIVLTLWYAYYGVLFSFSLGLVFLALLRVTLLLGRTIQFVKELTPFIVLLMSYEALQGVAGSLALAPVIHHTGSGVSYGIIEAVQSAFLSPDLTDVMSILYGLHFPLVIGSAILLWYSNKILYTRYVYSLVACSYVSLVFYTLAPSAPPWYNGVASNLLASTSAQIGSSGLFSELAGIGSLIESDKLAAFPSLHAAYVVLFSYFTIRLKRTYGLVSIPITLVVLFSTIYLGQHYITDLVAGVAVAAVCVLMVTRLDRKGNTSFLHHPSESSKTKRARIADVNSTKSLGEELSKICLETASRENATYADFRLVNTVTEVVSVINENPATEELNDLGAGIRVLYKHSGWGFADTDEVNPETIRDTTRKALALARGAAKIGSKVSFVKEPVHVADWISPKKKDPLSISTDTKYGVLQDAAGRMKEEGIVARRGQILSTRIEKYFANSEGSKIFQDLTQTGASLIVAAKGPSGIQRRSVQQYVLGGYELVDELDLPGQAPTLTKEVLALTEAERCPEGKSDIIISADQVGLQVHESCGHPIELDRVLGYEANFAGRSFLTPDQLGKLQYGSKHVNIVMDATVAHGYGLGTFAYDDEGVQAQRKYAVKDGKFVGYLMSRETASQVGEARSNGCMRADTYKLPIIRMTNVSLEPGDWDYDEMIEDTRDGILMDTNYGWSIDQKRFNFQFNCEKGYRIKNGSLAEMIRGPGYSGITPEFWNSCDAIGNQKKWALWGTPNCGKGQPQQVMGTGHGAAPSRFRNIRTFGAS